MGALDWSPIPARNAITDPTIAARDGASAREYPSLARGIMAGVAALAADQGGALVSTGTDNVYDVATLSGVTKPQPGTMISFWAHSDNTAAPFLNVDGTGPKRWLGADGTALPAGSIQEGLLYTVAWSAALPGSVPGWRLAAGGGAGLSATGIAFDFSGSLADRAQYDAQPKGKTFLAVADTPLGPSWVLYLKRSNALADWSTGLPIKASPAQSTADAQAAAEAAGLQVGLAQIQAQAASTARTLAEQQADLSSARAGEAANQASAAAVSAIEARSAALLIGAQAYDFSFNSDASPTDDWSN